MNQNRKKSKISYFISLAMLLIILYFAYQYYQLNNFNDFVRSETNLYTSNFTRDDEIKYTNKKSYKIESPEYNDAMFYQTIKVKKNQPYRVTCMVKTKDVQAKEEKSGVGAQISIEGTTERSDVAATVLKNKIFCSAKEADDFGGEYTHVHERQKSPSDATEGGAKRRARRSRFSEEHIIGILRQAEPG